MNDASSPVIENASADHPDVEFGKIGVLLINLGTPDSTDPASLRRYLAEFLTDRRVIEWPRWLRYLNRPGFAGGSNFQIGWSHDEQSNEQIFP